MQTKSVTKSADTSSSTVTRPMTVTSSSEIIVDLQNSIDPRQSLAPRKSPGLGQELACRPAPNLRQPMALHLPLNLRRTKDPRPPPGTSAIATFLITTKSATTDRASISARLSAIHKPERILGSSTNQNILDSHNTPCDIEALGKNMLLWFPCIINRK